MLTGLRFRQRFVDELPGDKEEGRRPRQVLGACYSRASSTPVAAPRVLAVSADLMHDLGILRGEAEEPRFAQVFGGNAVLPGMRPYAACYGGHQFGVWAGQLGDGRALTLGELIVDGDGDTSHAHTQELQLKGSGPTPYSRSADGRAVLRSSLREFVCSEAMHRLGVPTTRALCLLETGEKVLRDTLYDGRVREEPGAIVCRVAPSFLRFGNFEIFAARGDEATLRRLGEHALRHHFPDITARHQSAFSGPEPWLDLLREVCRRTARMIAGWMHVGFVHGVMNTDNMSLLGLTIDYGPYGWLEGYDPNWTPNTTDAEMRRYRYGNQPSIALWNLARFAESLLPLVGETRPLEDALDTYKEVLAAEQATTTAAKLGLRPFVRNGSTGLGAEDRELLEELMTLLQQHETDTTLFYRRLAHFDVAQTSPTEACVREHLVPSLYAPQTWSTESAARAVRWFARYAARARNDGFAPEERIATMNGVNPARVPRNYLVQEAIDAAEQADLRPLHALIEALHNPYDDDPRNAHFAAKRPEWARHRVGCSMLSCSS